MKKIKVTESVTVFKYQAIDGTLFTDEANCKAYEETAQAVLKSRVNKLIVGRYDSWELHGGADDNDVIAIKFNTQQDVDAFMQYYYLCNPHLINSDNEETYKKYREKYESLAEKAFKEKDFLLIGISCDGDYYFINTRNDIISNLKNLDNPPAQS